MQCTAAPSLEHRASCVLHFVLLVFVYTEVRTLEVLGVMTRTMILRITILAIWVSTPHLVLWRITRCSCLHPTCPIAVLLWCASSTTSWATILLEDRWAGELIPTTRAREGPYRTLRSLDLGGIQYRAHALRIVCVVLVLPCYSVHHCAGYAPSCTWRVIAGTSHPEHEHVIFVYLEIWHPRSHPTSRILDISDSGHPESGSHDLDLWIWRSGGSRIWIWGSRPLGTLRIPRKHPF